VASRRIIFAEGLRRKLVDTSVTTFRTQTALARGKKGGRSVYDLNISISIYVSSEKKNGVLCRKYYRTF